MLVLLKFSKYIEGRTNTAGYFEKKKKEKKRKENTRFLDFVSPLVLWQLIKSNIESKCLTSSLCYRFPRYVPPCSSNFIHTYSQRSKIDEKHVTNRLMTKIM